MDKAEYLQYIKKAAPKTKQFSTLLKAFLIGGAICCVGQGVSDILSNVFKITDKIILGSYTSIIMIFLGSLFTAIGLYDRLGAIAGAGSIVPITGFANSIVSPAMEYNREGIVLGVMSKMFIIAGPVIVSGIGFSILIGIIHWVVSLIA